MIDGASTALRAAISAGARVLDLSRCGLTAFPSEIFELAETLEVLDLGHNGLTGLPDDLGRLTKLLALFGSGNPLTRLPPGLGACASLGQVGFRGCGLVEVPAEALPPALRWLTLTDNRIATLPDAIGRRPRLQKLMLAGNRLTSLPESLAEARNLELLRLAANRFETLPSWLTRLPRLAWLAWAGNPCEPAAIAAQARCVEWRDLEQGALLGEGASGRIHHALWAMRDGGPPRPVAVKLFKGAMTSDGRPACEMAACLAAGDHPNLIGGLGRLACHPEGLDGLLMPLLPDTSRVLAGPPSRESCSRDVYDPALRLDRAVALRLAACIGAAAAHLHARNLQHGDLYAHNILWDGMRGEATLSDFGAASFMPPAQAADLEKLDVLAWGLLLGELLDRCGTADVSAPRRVAALCTSADPIERPRMAEALDML